MGHVMDREMTVSPGRFWREALEVARKDLRVEARTAETLRVTVPFGATALLLIPLAVGADIPLLRALGPGMYWTVVLLFGVLVTLRQSAVDTPAQRDLLALLGVDPAACFVGRAGASALLLLAFQAMLGPVALVLYDPQPIGWAWLALLAPLVAVGLALLGTLAGALTERLPGRSSARAADAGQAPQVGSDARTEAQSAELQEEVSRLRAELRLPDKTPQGCPTLVTVTSFFARAAVGCPAARR